MWLSPHTRHTQRIPRRRNHLGVSACLMIAVLVTGILIGRISRGPEAPEQVFLNNAAPGTPTPTAERPASHAEETRAPLGTVVRRTSAPRTQHARPTSSVSKAPRDANTIEGSYGRDGHDATTIGPEFGSEEETSVLTSVEAEVVRLTNAARRRAGCRALRVDDRLVRAAKEHSRDMAVTGRLSHTSPDGSSPWQRMERAGYRDGGAENIGRGYRHAEEAVRGWMGSHSHRQNIINCTLRAIGVGVAEGDGELWWTQDFGYS